jgi:hypothetical protein
MNKKKEGEKKRGVRDEFKKKKKKKQLCRMRETRSGGRKEKKTMSNV